MPSIKNRFFTAGIAAIAMAATPAVFAQGNGKGNGGEKSARVKGNGNGNAGDQGPDKRDAGPRDTERRGTGNGNGNGNGNSSNGRSDLDQRGQGGNAGSAVRGGNGNAGNRQNASNGNSDNIRQIVTGASDDRRVRIRSRDGSDLDVGFALPQLRQALVRDTRIIDGCPPGLAKKRNGCLPPGQAKQAYRSFDTGFFGINSFGNDRSYFSDGYLLSYRGNNLAGYLPLLGGALGIGNIWPTSYAATPLPDYYSSYYGLENPRGYRFADNVIYRVDPETAAIASVAALLTGDDITIGQPLPRGYDVYNVPNSYREQYFDGPGANYRYSDGYIYEVDPETALVVAAIDLVT